MEDEEYTGLNPWHGAVCAALGLICRRCRFYYQGEEQWRRDFAGDPHRWYVMIATAAKDGGWKMTKQGFLCPKCVRAIKRHKRRKQRDD